MRAYVDTSVLAAYYCPEALSPVAQRALLSFSAPTISHLVELELHSSISLKVRTGHLDCASANRVVSMFQVHKSDGAFCWAEIGEREYGLARGWIARFSTPLRTLDALHLAAAFAAGIPLYTADVKLASASELLGVDFVLLEPDL